MRDGTNLTRNRRNVWCAEQDLLRARRAPQLAKSVPQDLSQLLTVLLTAPSAPRVVPSPTLDLYPVRSVLVVTSPLARGTPTATGATLELSQEKVPENAVCALRELTTQSSVPELSALNVNLVVMQVERVIPSAVPVPSDILLSSMDLLTVPLVPLENTSNLLVAPHARIVDLGLRTLMWDRPSVWNVLPVPLPLDLPLWSAASALLDSLVLIPPRQPVIFAPLAASPLWRDLHLALNAKEEVLLLMRV